MRTIMIALIFYLVSRCSSRHAGESNGSPVQRMATGVREAFAWMSRPFTRRNGRRTPTTVKVAHVGLGRTGTTSLKTALEVLEFTSLKDEHVHEVADVFGRAARGEMSFDSLALEVGRRGFDDVFFYGDDYYEWVANTDGVRAILSIRDDAATWARSYVVVSSFGELFRNPPFVYLQQVKDMLPVLERTDHTHTNGSPELHDDIATLEAAYVAHVEKIKKLIPKERLLVLNVREGWGPLCAFLGVPVPEEKFPHVNDHVVMRALVATLWAVAYAWKTFPAILGLTASAILIR
eukprot:TRINITY_DN18473_c0_g1_i1.p2 TRINITY_DN18473_c0_g1~~TRINITY_DN18473_c0_g1_i1.p2  ORF type:complete len:292 (-),score=36.34 TRINITY_DN18473_c0_g1_i1:219-1094(-)